MIIGKYDFRIKDNGKEYNSYRSRGTFDVGNSLCEEGLYRTHVQPSFLCYTDSVVHVLVVVLTNSNHVAFRKILESYAIAILVPH